MSILVQSSKMNNYLRKSVQVTMKKGERTTIISVKIHHTPLNSSELTILFISSPWIAPCLLGGLAAALFSFCFSSEIFNLPSFWISFESLLISNGHSFVTGRRNKLVLPLFVTTFISAPRTTPSSPFNVL